MKLAYSIQEACGLLSIGRTTLYALIGQGDLAVLKIGRRTLISAKSLDTFIQAVERQNRGCSGRDSLGDLSNG
jgi:excisionase family DNA binding protein